MIDPLPEPTTDEMLKALTKRIAAMSDNDRSRLINTLDGFEDAIRKADADQMFKTFKVAQGLLPKGSD